MSKSKFVCRFIHVCGEVPKYRARCRAVSAVIARFSRTIVHPGKRKIQVLRETIGCKAQGSHGLLAQDLAGMDCIQRHANPFFFWHQQLLPRVSVIIDDFDLVRVFRLPHEADSIPIVDADAELPFPVAPRRFQAVARRSAKR
jgi:hypothetical protein